MDAVQERQLVLMEKMIRRLDAIQEGQKKLEEANATLRNENETLRTELERQQQLQKTQKSRRGRKSSVQSTVEVPNDLRVGITQLDSYRIHLICLGPFRLPQNSLVDRPAEECIHVSSKEPPSVWTLDIWKPLVILICNFKCLSPLHSASVFRWMSKTFAKK